MDWTADPPSKRTSPTTLRATLDDSFESWILPDDMAPGYWIWMIVYSNGELSGISAVDTLVIVLFN